MWVAPCDTFWFGKGHIIEQFEGAGSHCATRSAVVAPHQFTNLLVDREYRIEAREGFLGDQRDV